MVEKTFVYDGTTEALRQIPELQRQGIPILCPKCGAELIVALDFESAKKHKVHTGIYCPQTRNHVCELMEIRPDIRSNLGGF